jgi:carotenoid 1,2-hydratase
MSVYPGFDSPVAHNGYRWWYIDALSDDGTYGLAIIGLLGNPFSPFYARKRQHAAQVDPFEFNAMNVVLYRRGRKRWCFTEYGAEQLDRSDVQLQLGPNDWQWDGERLKIVVDERSPILRAKIKGHVELSAAPRFDSVIELDNGGRHHWWPIAPHSRIRVELTNPRLRFEGKAYHDSNWGSESLVDGFVGWNWSRSELDGGTAIIYDTVPAVGDERRFARFLGSDGQTHDLELNQAVQLGRSRWGIRRQTRFQSGKQPRLLRSLENSPFYTRSLLRWFYASRSAEGVHESMDLDRFRRPWVKFLFYLRMRKAVSWSAVPRLGLWARLLS